MKLIATTISDADRTIHGLRDTELVERIVACLTAEPETIAELEAALPRFIQQEESCSFDLWSDGEPTVESADGVCTIDLTARMVVCESPHFSSGPNGKLEEWVEDLEVWTTLSYRLSSDWLFLDRTDGWEAVAAQRRAELAEQPPLDAREVLFGKVAEFIVEGCLEARNGPQSGEPWDFPESWEWRELPGRAKEERPPTSYDAKSEIHARWLMTPRDDLRGKTPREVMFEKHDFVSGDISARKYVWSMLEKPPPALSRESAAFRFAGFGTHEIVLYYDLARAMLDECWGRVVELDESAPEEADPAPEVRHLNAFKDEWLNSTRLGELHDQTPWQVMEWERMRMPQVVSGHDATIDHDCPLCLMMGNPLFGGPTFWNLDGSHADWEYPFSPFEIFEEWEEEDRDYQEFSRKCDERRAREAEQEAQSPEGKSDPPSIWKRTFSWPSPGDGPATRLFGLGGCVAEIVTELKERPNSQAFVDKLNRQFDNLREVVPDPSGALLEPVVQRFCDELNEAGQAYPDLAERCADLERQLHDFAEGRPETPSDWEPPEWDDDDVPF